MDLQYIQKKMVEKIKLQYKKPCFILTKIITLYTAKFSLKQSMLKIAIKRNSGINQKHQKNTEIEWEDKNGTTIKKLPSKIH